MPLNSTDLSFTLLVGKPEQRVRVTLTSGFNGLAIPSLEVSRDHGYYPAASESAITMREQEFELEVDGAVFS